MEDNTRITCLRCGRQNSPDVRFCDYCGERIEQKNVVCANCGHSNPPGVRYYCDRCEQPLVAVESEPVPDTVAKEETQPDSNSTSETPQEPPATNESASELAATNETTPESVEASETTPQPPSPELDPGFVLCPRCQHRNEPDSSYCYHCGLPLDDESIPGYASNLGAFQQGTPGGFWIRFLAYVLDTIVITVVNLVLYGLFAEDISDMIDPESPFGFLDLVSTLFGLMYAPVLIGLWGTTVGKKPFELYVIRDDGGRCGFWRALGRELAKFISAIILLVGFIMIAFRKDKRGLHDLIAGTVVIKR